MTQQHPARSSARLNLRPCAWAVALTFSPLAFGNPTGPQVAAGAASFSAAGKTLTVTNAPGTIINWQSFSIGQGEHTRFQQQSASSAILNRVVGSDPSSILGRLTSNGRVFLINPHGILFGAGAQIDTAGLIASTLNLSDRDFLSGNLRFEGGGHGLLRNEGTIRASGDIVLVGPAIENAGLIRSDAGSVLLAAGHRLTITSPDAHGVKFEVQAPEDRAVNLGAIHASNAATMLAGTLRHSGDIRAVNAHLDAGGRVVLSAQQDARVESGATVTASGAAGGSVLVQSGAATHVAGDIDASSTAAAGGTIQILGERVAVATSASVNASGSRGGGTVLVGGDYQGRNPDVRNAQQTVVAAGATLRADGVETGHGGRVIVWADDSTRFDGTISARGGAQSGDGGFVETSGKNALSVISGRVDTRASHGRTGQWLLDPSTIVVGPTGPLPPNNTVTFADGEGSPALVSADAINGATTDVTLQANTDIIFSAGSPISMVEAGVGLTAQAGRSIQILDDISTNNGALTFVANELEANGVRPADRLAGAAQITMAPGKTINAGNANVSIRLDQGVGPSPSGDITLANVIGGNVSVVHNGPTANSRIVRANDSALITGSTAVYLGHAPAGAAGSIGTDAAPVRVATPRLEAHLTSGVGGIFIDSPNAGDLQVGGVDVHTGAIRGVQAPAGGPIRLTVNGALSRFEGTGALCGLGGGTGGPICATGLQGDITLQAAALGGAGPSGRLHVDVNGGTVNATSTTGGVFLEQRTGQLLLSRYTISEPAGQPLELATGNGPLRVDNNIAAAGRPVVLASSASFPITFDGGVEVSATSLVLNGFGPATFDAGIVTLNATVASAVPMVVSGATVNVNGPLAMSNALTVAAGRLNLNAGASLGAASVSNGILAAAAPVAITGGLTLTGGTVTAASPVTVLGGLRINGGTPQLSAAITTDTLNITGGSLQLLGGSEIRTTGGAASGISEGTLQIDAGGLFQLANGNLNFNDGARIENSGVFTIDGEAGLLFTAGSAPSVLNSGELRKTGAGTSVIGSGVAVTNTGTVDVQSGTLQVAGLAANAGTINVASGTTFSTNGGALTSSGTIRGSGRIELGGATLTNDGRLQPGGSAVATLELGGSLAQGPAGQIDIDLTGTAPDQADRVAISGSATLGGVLNVQHVDGFNPPSDSSYTLLSYVSSSGDFATRNVPSGYSGFYNSSFGPSGYTLSLGAVVNAWTAPGSGLWQDSVNWSLGHAPTAGEDALIPDLGALGANETITMSDAGTLRGARRLTSAENLTVNAGTFTLGPLPTSIGGTFAVNGTGTATLDGPIAANAIELSGSGSLLVGSGTLPRLTMSGGFLGRPTPGDLTLTGPFTASGGIVALSAPGDRLITAGVTTVLNDGADPITTASAWHNTGVLNLNGPLALSGATFTNAQGGTLNVNTGGLLDLGVAQLSNSGLVNLRTSDETPFGAISTAGSIVNNGSIIKSAPDVAAGADFVNLIHPVTNTATGIIGVDVGTLSAAFGGTQSGTFRIASGVQLNTDGALTNAAGGVITGTGTLELGGAVLTNNGTLRPGTPTLGGALTVNGDLVNNATLAVRLAGQSPAQFGRLNVSGTATLGGTLALSTFGGYGAPEGDTFTILNAAAVVGDFVSITPPTSTIGVNILRRPTFYLVGLGAPDVNSWISDVSGNWNDPVRWSLGRAPVAADRVFIRRPTNPTVNVPAGRFEASTLRSTENVDVIGTLALAGASSVNALLSIGAAGVIESPGGLSATDLFLSGTVAAGSGVTANESTVVSGNAAIRGRLTSAGAFTMPGGGTLVVSPTGELTLSGSGEKRVGGGGVLNVQGTVALSGTSNLVLNEGSQLAIANTGRFDLQSTAGIASTSGAPGAVANAGALFKSGAGISTIGTSFSNTQNVSVDAGTLRIAGDGLDSGAYAVSAGAVLDFSGGSRSINAGSTLSGPGTVATSGGTVSVNVPYSAPVTSVTGGVMTFNAVTGGGRYAVIGGTLNSNAAFDAASLTLTGGAANFNGALTRSVTALDLRGGVLSAGGRLEVSGGTWTGGVLSGAATELAIRAGAVFGVTGTADKAVQAAAISNSGTVALSGSGSVFLNDGARVTNIGMFDVQGDADIENGAGAATFANLGTLRKSGGVGTTLMGTDGALTLSNSATGTLDVRSGTLAINAAFATNDGTLEIASGTTLTTPGALTNAGGAAIGGAGTLNLAGATLTNRGRMRPGVQGGTTGTLSILGGFTNAADGNVDLRLGGTNAGAFDALSVTGPTGLAGVLNLTSIGAYTPASGDTFSLINAGALTGTFDRHTKNFAQEILPSYGASTLTLALGPINSNTWIANASGSWTDGTRWSQTRAPIATDRVTIDRPGALTIAIPAGAHAAQVVNSQEDVTLAGTLTLAERSTFGGTLGVNGGTLSGAGGINVTGVLSLVGASLDTPVTADGGVVVTGSAPNTLNNTLTANGFNAQGPVANASGSTLVFLGSGEKAITSAAFTNRGVVNFEGGADLALSSGALFDNFGTFNHSGSGRVRLTGATGASFVNRGSGRIQLMSNAPNAFVFDGPASGKSFVNAGTLEKAAGSAVIQSLDVPLTNTGTVAVRTGTLVVSAFPSNSGTLEVFPGATLSTGGAALTNSAFGLVKGGGTLSLAGATLTNNGTVAPGRSPGTLTIDGNYAQGSGGTLAIELGGVTPGTDYDLLRITGSAALGGTLVVTQTADAPILEGSRFEFMRYASRTGDFAGFSVPPGFSFRPQPGPTSYAVTNSAAPATTTIAQAAAVAQNETVTLTETMVVTQTPDNTDPDAERRGLGECR